MAARFGPCFVLANVGWESAWFSLSYLFESIYQTPLRLDQMLSCCTKGKWWRGCRVDASWPRGQRFVDYYSMYTVALNGEEFSLSTFSFTFTSKATRAWMKHRSSKSWLHPSHQLLEVKKKGSRLLRTATERELWISQGRCAGVSPPLLSMWTDFYCFKHFFCCFKCFNIPFQRWNTLKHLS